MSAIPVRYEAVEPLGRGGQGQIWAVRDLVLGRRVVMKAAGVAPGARAQLGLEFERMAAVEHPALPRVHDLGVLETPLGPWPAGTVYVTRDEVPGVPLDAAVAAATADERGPLLWSVARDVAAALAALHAAGLCHCDVTPANVLVDGRGGQARAVLVDLGLATARGPGDAARGTLAFMAPEALLGVIEPRGDLFGLGASLWAAARGRPPRSVDDGREPGEVVRAILRAELPPLDEAEAPGLVGLVARLVAREPAARPPSALALVRELDVAAAAIPAVVPRPPPALRPSLAAALGLGADAALAALVGHLDRAADGGPGAAVLVSGPIGVGARAVVTEALRRHQRARVAAGAAVVEVRAQELAPRLDDTGGLGDDGAARRLALAVVTEARAARGATVVSLTGDERAAAVVAAAGAGAGPGLLVLVLEGEPPPVPPDVVTLAVGPIDPARLAGLVADLLGRAPPAGWTARLHAAARGLPALAAELCAALPPGDPFAHDPAAVTGAALDEARRAQVDACGPAARAAAEALAVWDGASAELLVATAAATDDDDDAPEGWPPPAARGPWLTRGLGRLLELGLARADDAVIGAPALALAGGLAAALRAALSPARRQLWQRAAVAAARARDLPVERWAAQLAALPVDDEAAATLVGVARARLAAGQPARALPLATAATVRGGALGAEAALVAARAALALGRYRDAIEHARTAAAGAPEPRAARWILARALQRAGELDQAEAELVALTALAPADVEIGAAHARLLVARDRHSEALARVRALEPLPRTAAGALAAEAAGSALLYQRDPAGAERWFREVEAIADATADRALAGRARALRGMVAQQQGDLAAAAELYRGAAELARAGGELHAAAVAELNRGSALAERGRHGQALPVLAEAARGLRSLGRVELAVAELDRGVSLLAVGEVTAAAAAAAAAVAGAAGLPHVLVHALVLAGDVARRQGEPARARARYQEAIATGRAHGLAERGHGLRALAELDADHDRAGAEAALAEAALADAGDDDRDRTVASRARVALAPPLDVAVATALLEPVAALAERAAAADRLEQAWRAGALAAALADVVGARERGDALAARAHAVWSALAASTPEPWRAGLAAEPEAAALLRRHERPPPAPPAAVDERGPARLRRLLALSRRLNSEPSLDRLLDDVIDAAIELTAGERGFLLLARGPTAALEVVVARGFTTGAVTDPGALSRSIAHRAMASGEPVITVDAGVDERFGQAASVAALRLRSVLAVPLAQRGRVTGCLYVDHRLRASAFDDDAASLLLELADIAAVAIENATLADDLRRGKAEIEALNARLAAEVAEREAELTVARSRLPPSRERLGPGLAGIVGSAPSLLAALDVVVRAARVALPVVVVGESGTGKELVARAIHDSGPRRERPFVALNCSAMPEALLESELFGHVRGAFTGADRDRKGLFEVADGGTLFLDEIADTGLAMQAKLLRVLQDGVVRRVGDERTRKVDVRIVAASQRPLAELVAAGRFREDLRYRLDVIAVVVPPLRARRSDVPALVDHLLRRLCGDRPLPTLTRAAWRALGEHDWPGNVRELENALARAVALGGDVLDVVDLPEAVATRPRPVAGGAPPDDLRLRPAVDALERGYVAAALARAHGNQTAAARLLGLSRFGLQKKLRRLAGETDEA